MSPSVSGDLAFVSFSVFLPSPVLSSVADSCGILEEASPGAAYLYGPCALRACRADRKALQQNTLCVWFHTYTQITLVHLLFLSRGDVAALGESLSAVPRQVLPVCVWVGGGGVYTHRHTRIYMWVSVCVCILKPTSEHVKNS